MQSTSLKAKLIVLVAAVALAAAAVPAGAVSLAAGDVAPGFALKDLDGKSVTLDQFRGKTVVIAFWSTWCSRCEEELVFLRDTFGGKNDVAVILINQDSEKMVPKSRILSMRDRLGISFPILIDENLSLWEIYGINALPTSVVVGANGQIRLIEPNFYWGSPDNITMAAMAR